uniref:Poly(A) specific ribonuclease subunit PAN2 n=1 Tax=Cyclopterus lumpus TaxID=8103 RepID=A0A8C3G2W1_CYCLU
MCLAHLCSSLGSSGESAIGKLFGCEVENSSLCRCGKETVRSSLSLLFTMHYPEQNSQEKTIKEYDFSEILKKSICLEQSTQATEEEEEGASVYDLVVTVPHILDARTGGNLVAHIKVGETYHQRKEGVTHQQWYLFNDFLIEPIDKTEAAQFDVSWKVPGILYYAKRNYHTKYDLRIKNPIDASVLLTEASLARKQRKSHATFIPLMVSEMPQAGELVGLDAEFVTLNQEEAELRSDGTKSTIKPSQMSVARITCVRGQGPNEGVPFIDDYISTQEQVVDYLTQYSGIKPGDLDAKISSKHLTTLKSTYLKLRFLIDTGVRFVGHGLQKDFRVINLLVFCFFAVFKVLKDQVVDTVYLFHLPRKRMISLRFLAWYFLELNIQGETHDSIEDARTALQLYRKHLELSRAGGNDEVRKVLKGLYEKGRQLDWKVPESETGDGQGSPKSAAVFPSVMGL